MKKIFYYACLMMFAFATTSVLMACGDDDDDTQGNQGGLVGWYIRGGLETSDNLSLSSINDGTPFGSDIMHIIDDHTIDIYLRPKYLETGSEMREDMELIYKFKDGYGFYATPLHGTYTKTDEGFTVVMNDLEYLVYNGDVPGYQEYVKVNFYFSIENGIIKSNGNTGGYNLPGNWAKYDINKTY